MIAEELRLGNMVTRPYSDEIYQVESIVKNESFNGGYEIVASDGTRIAISHIVPIPLTEEILLKCGFGRRGDKYYLIIQTGAVTHSIYIEYVFSGDTGYGDMWIGKETGQTKRVFLKAKYLHDLQNLIHGLVKKELEVSL